MAACVAVCVWILRRLHHWLHNRRLRVRLHHRMLMLLHARLYHHWLLLHARLHHHWLLLHTRLHHHRLLLHTRLHTRLHHHWLLWHTRLHHRLATDGHLIGVLTLRRHDHLWLQHHRLANSRLLLGVLALRHVHLWLHHHRLCAGWLGLLKGRLHLVLVHFRNFKFCLDCN